MYVATLCRIGHFTTTGLTDGQVQLVYVGTLCMYYKPMGDLLYSSTEQGGLIIHTEFIYELP